MGLLCGEARPMTFEIRKLPKVKVLLCRYADIPVRLPFNFVYKGHLTGIKSS